MQRDLGQTYMSLIRQLLFERSHLISDLIVPKLMVIIVFKQKGVSYLVIHRSGILSLIFITR